jgi:hypothetical protein
LTKNVGSANKKDKPIIEKKKKTLLVTAVINPPPPPHQILSSNKGKGPESIEPAWMKKVFEQMLTLIKANSQAPGKPKRSQCSRTPRNTPSVE